MAALNDASMLELKAQLDARQVSSVEATQACLTRIAAVDPKVRAFLCVDAEGALAAAKASDARRATGQLSSAFDGVPIAVKDIFCTTHLPTTAGSKMLEGFRSPYDATVVEKLRAAGLPLLGKLNMDEFAMGSSNENSAFFPTHNPYDLTRTPGGSSGGSAAAVAAREAFATLGTDTGGSIRLPAAMTHVVGLKPTWGRVSRHGVVAFASSLDQVGPLARTVGDVAALLQLIAGEDPHDSTAARVPVPDYSRQLEAGARGLKLGVPREYFAAGLDPEVEASVRAAIKEYEQLGATVVEVSLPHTPYALATYYLLASAEASSNLGRYDGVRFGHRTSQPKGLTAMYEHSRSEGFGPEVKRRILLGTFALAAGYYDAYYLKAQKVRTLIRRDFEQVFSKVDALICATSPVPAFKLGEKSDPLSMYLMDVLTIPASLAGVPAISVPFAKAAAVLILAEIALFVPQQAWSFYKTLLEKDSFYHHIRVQQDEEARYLYFDQTLQSAMNLNDPSALRLVYSRYVSLGFAFRPDARKALVVGLGGGSVPKKWQKEFPSMEIDVAEIDPEVVDIAKRYFSFQEGKNLKSYAQDGRLFLTRSSQRYDVILLDAYFKDSIPFHLTTKEFFAVASQKLASNGVVVMNIIGAVTGPGGKITRSVAKTLRGSFPQVYIFAARRPENASLETIQNVILVATKSAERVDIREILKRAGGLNASLFPKSLNDIAVAFVDGKVADDDVPVLTDDYAPTDKLLHP